MSQIMYNYPAMMAHAADMAGYAGTLQSLCARYFQRAGRVGRPVGRVTPG